MLTGQAVLCASSICIRTSGMPLAFIWSARANSGSIRLTNGGQVREKAAKIAWDLMGPIAVCKVVGVPSGL